MTWLKDSRGNKCSVEWFGTKEAAQKALDSLIDCDNCENCSRCSGCSDCSDCSGCSRCSDCSRCSRCSDCSRCSGCSDCSRCSGCSDCSDCSGCSRCSDCSRCSGLTDNKPTKCGSPEVPVIEDIHKKVYAAANQNGCLNMSNWHTCETTHCRAGWVVHLAGEKGKELEKFFNTPLAAMKIYDASCPGFKINPCRFYDDNEAAMEDMRKLAEDK